MAERVIDLPGPTRADARAEGGALTLAAIYRQEFGFIWRAVRSFGVDEGAAADVTQEVFVIAHRRLADFDPAAGSLRSWLFGIARNVARHHHRSVGRKDPRRLEPPTPAGLALDPEEQLRRDEAIGFVEAFLAGLDDRHREVFVLHEVEGLQAPAIGDLVGASVNTVYSRLRRARELLSRALARRRAREGDQP
ncbi:MAG: sigma-70 family RNA polymerase sigma factor [Nannocystaceae bacterium]